MSGRHPARGDAATVNGVSAPATIFTIGYERLLPGPLVAELQAAGVRRLIDVRFRPQSRRAGMSKTRLGALLDEHGIAYEHRRSLGTPPDLRHLYKHGRVAAGAEGFTAHIEATAGEELDALAATLGTAPPTALLCLEADPAECHRRVLTDALRARRPGLRVVDL
ncbi:MAG: hypothetical protein JWN65_2566 [Solirubrobacterales bacterium]|nr:hypothetical protein [Solirubrobacterales bacterium]